MPDRYYSAAPIQGETVTLDGPEAHHLRDVMRGQPGQQVLLFDGSGHEFTAEIVAARRQAVELRVVSRLDVNRELPAALHVAVALPKGERQRWLVEKLVELGVTRLLPLDTERSVAEATAGALTRMRRGVIEATKQCGRTRLMEIAEPQSLAALLAAPPSADCRMLAHPDAADAAVDASTRSSAECAAWLAIGPEGGFTSAEVARARAAGWTIVALGPRVLRVETAAVLLAGMAAQHLQQAAQRCQ